MTRDLDNDSNNKLEIRIKKKKYIFSLVSDKINKQGYFPNSDYWDLML